MRLSPLARIVSGYGPVSIGRHDNSRHGGCIGGLARRLSGISVRLCLTSSKMDVLFAA